MWTNIMMYVQTQKEKSKQKNNWTSDTASVVEMEQ